MQTLQEQLNAMKEKVQKCTNCSLCENRNKIVFSDGCECAPIMFIGEAPGKKEDETGIPFIGRAGQLLRKYLFECGFSANDFYIANTVKCRPPKNRVPEQEEKLQCENYLHTQIDIIEPKVIIFCGATALKSFSESKTPISKIRGELMGIEVRGKKYKAMPIFHPSYLLRQHSTEPGAPRDLMLQDLKKIKSIIK